MSICVFIYGVKVREYEDVCIYIKMLYVHARIYLCISMYVHLSVYFMEYGGFHPKKDTLKAEECICRTDACLNSCMYVCVCVCVHVNMYVCM